MKRIIFFFLLLTSIAQAQETAREIVERHQPKDSRIVHSIIQQNIWGNENAIIAFYETRYTDSVSTTTKFERQYVEAYLFLLKNAETEKILIHKFEDDNVDTEIQSVFFANADKDEPRELIIMSTVVHRLQYLYEGTHYSTAVFDDFKPEKIPEQLKLLDISQKLSGGFEGYTDAEGTTKATIKTSEDVRKKLKKMGYSNTVFKRQ